ncbi:MAG: NAD(P)/FAD-dependent oxidoreductase [Candidatus Omnitrophota bacterium]|nr:NAD(P)/FAD-dependent oxidoreductase [Candidatus Omnitrophota bacterium]MBU1929236.1 NAD(P)/FAD-dependent oxidoreductase [Candidatus Omnitrophota bacterium]MBU2034381.1 NAD(P)/FAD-dependent oxidoreductase [Candidatus Omnitrophota bacterium]
MKNKYDVIIIGAGIGGLTCGCYLAKAGLKVLIVEQHYKAGGYCTSFERQGYKFDVGVHYFGGIKKGILGVILDDLSLRERINFMQFNPTDKIITPKATTYIRSNPKDTIQEFNKNFPSEKKNIDAFFKFVKHDNFINIYKKTSKLTFKDVLDEFFKNQALKTTLNVLLRNIGLCANDASALATIIFLREYILDPGYYPQGGIQKFPDALLDRFQDFGGNVLLSQKVDKIMVRNNSAYGITLKNGNIFEAKYIISNADAIETFDKLLYKKTEELKKIKRMDIAPSSFIVYLGLNENFIKQVNDPCNIWPFSTYNLGKTPVNSKNAILIGKPLLSLITFPYSHDITYKNCKKPTMQLMALTSYESKVFWAKNRDKLTDRLIKEAETIFPSLKKCVVFKESATPITCYRYTSNSNGSAFGWASTVKQINPLSSPAKTSIKGLFLAGHWCTVGSGQGGIPKVAFSGRRTASLIFKECAMKSYLSDYLL